MPTRDERVAEITALVAKRREGQAFTTADGALPFDPHVGRLIARAVAASTHEAAAEAIMHAAAEAEHRDTAHATAKAAQAAGEPLVPTPDDTTTPDVDAARLLDVMSGRSLF